MLKILTLTFHVLWCQYGVKTAAWLETCYFYPTKHKKYLVNNSVNKIYGLHIHNFLRLKIAEKQHLGCIIIDMHTQK